MYGNFGRLFQVLVLAFWVCASTALATPAQVILIRHAEKPAKGPDLSAQGRQRANALVGYFTGNPDVTRYGTPVAIYAMAPNNEDGTLRPIQTMKPLAQKLGLELITAYKKSDYQAMVEDIRQNPAYEGRMVLICWEHNVIPQIVLEFGYSDGPSNWGGGSVYDRTWILNFTGDSVTDFANLPQHLLPGDDEA